MKKKPTEKTHVYFPGLHGLRFFAALLVVFGHVELLKDYHGFPNAHSHPAVYEMGRMGVTFFFVLSGFLITYLLLTERRVAGTIAVRKFYVRRVLRIWPLYFLLVALAFFVLPRLPFFHVPALSPEMPTYFGYTLPLFVCLLPQLALSVYPPVPFAEPLWSIGVEEQFYLLWPLLLKRVRNVFALSVGVVVAGFLVKQLALTLGSQSRDPEALKYWNYVVSFFYFTRIECMAVGALGAWLVFAGRRAVPGFLYHRATQLAVYALTAYALLTPAHKPVFNYTLYSALFGVIILNIATNPRSLVRVESRVFRFLGNISYSVYMFHEIAIKISMNALRSFGGAKFDDAASNVALYALSLLLTLGLASLSYLFFESLFLRLKPSFTVVASGEETHDEKRAGRLAATLPART